MGFFNRLLEKLVESRFSAANSAKYFFLHHIEYPLVVSSDSFVKICEVDLQLGREDRNA